MCGSFFYLAFLAVFALMFVSNFEFNDGKKFCALSSERSAQNPPAFAYNSTSGRHTNKGGRSCLEDIVLFVNTVRAGPDKLVSTQDDIMTLDEQLELLYAVLQQEFPGGYWAHGPWHINHNAGVAGQLKLVYGDINEYVMIFGNRFSHGGYGGLFAFDVWDLVLEGNHYTQVVGNMTRQLHTANFQYVESSDNPTLVAFLPRGTQKIYSSPAPDGAILLEYAYGIIPSSLYPSVIMPTIFINLDFRSAWISISHYAYSTILNSVSTWRLPRNSDILETKGDGQKTEL